jgi:hypothetical protein
VFFIFLFVLFVLELNQLATQDPLDRSDGETPVDEADGQVGDRTTFQ